MLKSPSLHVGDTVFYVLEDDSPRFRIHKTQIAEVTKKNTARFLDTYHYRCEDGYCCESVEHLHPNHVFLTRKEALSYVVGRLRSDLEYEKGAIVSVRQRLEQTRRSLNLYEHYLQSE